MILNIQTTTGTVQAEIYDSMDAVRVLRELANEGLKCVRWEVVKCS